jgi:1-acyl-sn-glycerol-3-phosphate acyltransferase
MGIRHSKRSVVSSADFYLRYGACLAWLLIMSVLGILLVPVLCWGRRLNSTVAHFGGWGLQRILRIRVRLDSSASLESLQPCVYVANHQDNLDVMVFGSIFPDNAIVVGKKEIGWIPFFNLFYVAGGNILLDRKHRTRAIAGIVEAGRKVKQLGRSVMIFPEGTRNRTGAGLLPFKKGAFHMAIGGELPIVPLVASPLSRHIDYAARRIIPGEIVVRRLETIPTSGLSQDDLPRIMEQTRSAMLAEFERLASR